MRHLDVKKNKIKNEQPYIVEHWDSLQRAHRMHEMPMTTRMRKGRDVHWRHDAENVLPGSTETDEEVLVLEALKNVAGDRWVELNAPHKALAAHFDAAVEGVHDVVQVLGNNLTGRKSRTDTDTKHTK